MISKDQKHLIYWNEDLVSELKNFFEDHLKRGYTINETIRLYSAKKDFTVYQVKNAFYNKLSEIDRLTLKNESVQENKIIERPDKTPPRQDNIEEEQIKKLIDLYRKKITMYIQPNEESGIRELYFWLKNRSLDPNKYIADAIEVFSRKEPEVKKNFGYLVSIVRNWTVHGYGYMPTKEDSAIFDLFESSLNIKLSTSAKAKLSSLLSKYGLTNLVFYFGKEINYLHGYDVSLMFVNKFEKLIEKYSLANEKGDHSPSNSSIY